MRLQKQLKRQLDGTTNPDEKAKIEADIHIAEVDRLYTIYYPFMVPYVSLYPIQNKKAAKEDTGDEASSAAKVLHAPRPPMWSTIEKTAEQGDAALERLQESRPSQKANGKTPVERTSNDDDKKLRQSRTSKVDEISKAPKGGKKANYTRDGGSDKDDGFLSLGRSLLGIARPSLRCEGLCDQASLFC